MKNLFDYATKELSQDAFLRWFLDNDIDNSGKLLLSKFTGLKSTKITKIETQGQVHKIDILVSFYHEGQKHYLVIEDKVDSFEHNDQLNKYRNLITKIVSNSGENIKTHFIYYKPRPLTEEEPQPVIKDNEWVGFGIEEIYSFFKNYVGHNNLIIDSYAQYISDLHTKLLNISSKPVIEWDHLSAQTFFRKTVETIFRSFHKGVKVSEGKIYQGHYANYKIYFTFENDTLREKMYPLIEFVFRKDSREISLLAHVSCRENDYWTWHWKDKRIDLMNKDLLVKEIQDSFVKVGFDRKGNLNNERTQTIGSYLISKDQPLEQIENEITAVIKKFVNEFDLFDSRLISSSK